MNTRTQLVSTLRSGSGAVRRQDSLSDLKADYCILATGILVVNYEEKRACSFTVEIQSSRNPFPPPPPLPSRKYSPLVLLFLIVLSSYPPPLLLLFFLSSYVVGYDIQRVCLVAVLDNKDARVLLIVHQRIISCVLLPWKQRAHLHTHFPHL